MNRQQLFTTSALRALNEYVDLDDAKTLGHNASAWLVQSGLAAGVDAVTRYRNQEISRWLLKTYTDVLSQLGYDVAYSAQGFRAWALSLNSVDNLRVNQALIEYNHTLTRLTRLKKEGLI